MEWGRFGKGKVEIKLISKVLCHEDVWGRRFITPPFFTSTPDDGAWSASHSSRFTPVPFEQKATWKPEPVWTLRWKEKSCTAGNRTQAVQLVAIPTSERLRHLCQHGNGASFQENQIRCYILCYPELQLRVCECHPRTPYLWCLVYADSVHVSRGSRGLQA